MSTTTTTAQPTKLPIGLVRFSYLHVWEAVAIEEGQDKKYSASLIIPKSDKALVKKITVAIEAAKQAGKDTKFGGKIPANLKVPLRDGDAERPDDENYKNSYFINCSAKTKPGIVDKDRNPILEQDQVYSGMFGYASVTFYPFNTSGNKGVAAGLNHIMKVKDGESLGGRATAENDFADLEVEDDDL